MEDRVVLIFHVVQIVGDGGGAISGRRSSAPIRNDDDDDRESMTYSMSGYLGYRETEMTHFAATNDQWWRRRQGGAMFSTTLMVAAEHGSGIIGGRIYYGEEGGDVGPWNPWAVVAIGGRYTEVTRILVHQAMSPFEAFGILALASEEYLGNMDW